eukprot:m.133079 g.133079  ORF g.133079 m.133079 type:complete len:289 (+) comp52404_c0_seq24:1131-1997(+)
MLGAQTQHLPYDDLRAIFNDVLSNILRSFERLLELSASKHAFADFFMTKQVQIQAQQPLLDRQLSLLGNSINSSPSHTPTAVSHAQQHLLLLLLFLLLLLVYRDHLPTTPHEVLCNRHLRPHHHLVPCTFPLRQVRQEEFRHTRHTRRHLQYQAQESDHRTLHHPLLYLLAVLLHSSRHQIGGDYRTAALLTALSVFLRQALSQQIALFLDPFRFIARDLAVYPSIHPSIYLSIYSSFSLVCLFRTSGNLLLGFRSIPVCPTQWNHWKCKPNTATRKSKSERSLHFQQ